MLVIFVGWLMNKRTVVSELNLSSSTLFNKLLFFLAKYLAPIGVLIVLIENSGIRKLVF